MKIYKKRGPLNYKEKKLVKQLEEALSKKFTEDAVFADSFKPAETLEELQAMYMQYYPEDVAFEETKAGATEESPTGGSGPSEGFKFDNPETPLEDPMNRANPIIREHVLKDTFSPEAKSDRPNIGGRPDLSEPTSYEEAFKLPEDEIEVGDKKSKAKQDNGSQNGSPGANKTKTSSMNPAFDDMTLQRKNKQTKRFAKYIVELFALGLEKGYVLFITKDINAQKLTEYELKDKIDPEHLEFLVSLSEEQEITIRQFFQLQCAQAEVNSKVSEDDRAELTDALADVLMEKGFAPTPMQTLMIVVGQIVAAKAIPAIVQNMQNQTILKQLFTMRAQQKQDQNEIVNHAVKETAARKSDSGSEEKPEESAQSTELTVATETQTSN